MTAHLAVRRSAQHAPPSAAAPRRLVPTPASASPSASTSTPTPVLAATVPVPVPAPAAAATTVTAITSSAKPASGRGSGGGGGGGGLFSGLQGGFFSGKPATKPATKAANPVSSAVAVRTSVAAVPSDDVPFVRPAASASGTTASAAERLVFPEVQKAMASAISNTGVCVCVCVYLCLRVCVTGVCIPHTKQSAVVFVGILCSPHFTLMHTLAHAYLHVLYAS
jgi:S-DNA-T family DNA segregation ATPase FtsK/SpoIIIE